MTEDEVRALVRQVIASRGGGAAPPVELHRHSASLATLAMVTPTTPGSPCIIEPTVGCNQCGYCVSMGH
jgi:hypothetical protein